MRIHGLYYICTRCGEMKSYRYYYHYIRYAKPWRKKWCKQCIVDANRIRRNELKR